MLKLYYDGWKEVGKPITVGKIESVSFSSGEDLNDVVNTWGGQPYRLPQYIEAKDSTIKDGDGLNALRSSNTIPLNQKKELFIDEDLTISTGLSIGRSQTSFEFWFGNELLYEVPLPSTGGTLGVYELCSIYAVESYDVFLRSIAEYETNYVAGKGIEVGPQGRLLSVAAIAPLAAPFVLHQTKTFGSGEHITIESQFLFMCHTNSCYLCFATLYKAYTGQNVVNVDKFTSAAFKDIEPSVIYDPADVDASKLSKNGGVVYAYNADADKFTIYVPTLGNTPQASSGVGVRVQAKMTEKTTTEVSNTPLGDVTTLATLFVQMGSEIIWPPDNTTSRTLKGIFENEIVARYNAAAPMKNPRWLSNFNTIASRRPTIIMTVPLWNVSKELKNDSKRNYGLLGDDNPIPLFVLSNVNMPFKYNEKYNVLNIGAVLSYVSSENEFSTITGADYSSWFYNGEVVDAGEKPLPPSSIPPDNGNGGFNDLDHLGGNGTWSDSTTDMTPDRNNPLWNIPQSLGLDANYDIVKLTRSAMESLASQTWTEKGWLQYLASFSNLSRASDGVVDVKTCFADIPSGNSARIAAIAGFGLKDPIPCSRIDQYVEFDMGHVDVQAYFGSFLDYSPYTELVLELPFAQPVQIPPEVVVGHSIGLKLYADVMSDTAMYVVHCNGRLIAQVPADIFIHIPFAASEYSQSAASALSGYVANAGGIGSEVKNAASNAVSAVGNAMTGNFIGAAVDAAESVGQVVTAPARMMHEVKRQEETRKITQISRGGGPGAIGAMTVKYAVLKISRPYVTIPPRYYELNGCPSGFVKKVGECKGYLEVSAIYGAIRCNTEEFRMITEVLGAGVFP